MLSVSPVVGIGTPPPPFSRRRVCPPTLWSGGGEGTLSPNSNEGTYTVVLYIYKYFVKQPDIPVEVYTGRLETDVGRQEF